MEATGQAEDLKDYKGKGKVYKTIKSVKPLSGKIPWYVSAGKTAEGRAKSVKPTGTKSLIGKYKKAVEKVKSTPDVIKRKTKAIKEIHGFVKKHGGTKADEAAGASIKGKK